MKSISFLQAVSISFGAIIGWGAFVMPGDLFLRNGGLITSNFAITIGAIMILMISFSYMYMMKKEGEDGVTWVLKYLGIRHAKFYTIFTALGYLSIIALNITALPLLLRYTMPTWVSFGKLYTLGGWEIIFSEVAVSIIVLVVFAYINKKEISAKTQFFIALSMVASILILLFWSIFVSDVSLAKEQTKMMEFKPLDFSYLAIIAVMPWAFVGFETTPQISTSIKNPRNIIILISIISGALFYMAVNFITAMNLDFNLDSVISSSWATGEGLKAKLGNLGFGVLAISMLGSILSGINGFMLTTIKVLENSSKLGIVKTTNRSNFIGIIFILCAMAPFLGRAYLVDIVSTASVGITLCYCYITYISFKICLNFAFKVLFLISFLISVSFIALLILPFSPAFLSHTSWLILIVFVAIVLLYKFIKG